MSVVLVLLYMCTDGRTERLQQAPHRESNTPHIPIMKNSFIWVLHSFIPRSVYGRSTASPQSEFSTESDLVLPHSVSSIPSFP